MTRGDWKFIAIMVCFLSAVGIATYGIGLANQALKDDRCHISYVISEYRIFNGTNTNDLYDVADHFVAYNGTTVANLAKQGWSLVKVAPDSVGTLYPLLGLRFEPLKVCK